MTSRLQLDAVWKFYENVPVLKNITYSFNDDTLYLLQGGNGAGKSTLLKILYGLVEPSEGLRNISDTDPGVISALIGKVPAYAQCSIRENLEFLTLAGTEAEGVDEILQSLQLQDYLDVPISNLSSGLYQRFALAQVFLNNSHWLLLDEPTTYLDAASKSAFLDCVQRRLSRGRGCIIATHDPSCFDGLPATHLHLSQGALLDA